METVWGRAPRPPPKVLLEAWGSISQTPLRRLTPKWTLVVCLIIEHLVCRKDTEELAIDMELKELKAQRARGHLKQLPGLQGEPRQQAAGSRDSRPARGCGSQGRQGIPLEQDVVRGGIGNKPASPGIAVPAARTGGRGRCPGGPPGAKQSAGSGRFSQESAHSWQKLAFSGLCDVSSWWEAGGRLLAAKTRRSC